MSNSQDDPIYQLRIFELGPDNWVESDRGGRDFDSQWLNARHDEGNEIVALAQVRDELIVVLKRTTEPLSD